MFTTALVVKVGERTICLYYSGRPHAGENLEALDGNPDVRAVDQVHDELSAHREFAYTTTLKLLQVMTEKGVAIREERGRA